MAAERDWEKLVDELNRQEIVLATVLLDAAIGQRPESKREGDEMTIFDNSLEGMPRRVSESMLYAPEDWRRWVYELYLCAKFCFLSALAEGSPDPCADVRSLLDQHLGIDSSVAIPQATLTLLVKDWSGGADQEARVLAKRIDQLGEGVVCERWGLDVPEYHRWRESVLSSTRKAALEAIEAAGMEEAVAQLAAALDDWRLESAVRLLERSLHRLSAHTYAVVDGGGVDGVGGIHQDNGELVATEPLDDLSPQDQRLSFTPVMAHLAHWLVDDARSGGLSFSGFCNEMAIRLAEHVHCRTADVLLVKEGRLGVVASSKSVEDLGAQKFYSRGEGITGSVLLVEPANPRPWVGTNSLLSDPRVSPKHVVKYSEVYGDIRDYWVFPLFDGESVFGAVRVVRRDDAYRSAGPPWPEHVLFALAGFSRWAEEITLRCFPGAEDRSTVAQTAGIEAAHRPMVRSLVSEMGLDFVETSFLEKVVAHLCGVSSRKVEKLSIGCTIAIVNDERVRGLARGLPSYRSVPELDSLSELQDASEFYNRVDPSYGVFVWSGSGRLHRVCQLPLVRGENGFDGCLRLSLDVPRSIVFYLARGQDCIRIAVGGGMVGDYFLSEATGNWTYRSNAQLRTALQSAVSKSNMASGWDTIDRVFDLVGSLSYHRVGSMIIVGDPAPSRVRMTAGVHPEQLYLQVGIDEHEFLDLARADGAMHIAWDGQILSTGVFVTALGTGRSVDEVVALDGHGGARHRSAKHFASAAGDCVVFVVSENRPITAYVGGEQVIAGK